MIVAACTTHRLSYIPNAHECLLPIKSYAPIRKYQPSDVPMESETTMQLSYQPVEPADQIKKPWTAATPYYSPVNPMEDNTTYNLRFELRSLSDYLAIWNSCCTSLRVNLKLHDLCINISSLTATSRLEHLSPCHPVPLLVPLSTPTEVNP